MNNSNCKEKIDVIKSVNNMIKNQISNMKIKNKSKLLKSNVEIVDDADFFPKLMNTLTRGDKGAKNLALEKTMFALSKNKYNIFKNLNIKNYNNTKANDPKDLLKICDKFTEIYSVSNKNNNLQLYGNEFLKKMFTAGSYKFRKELIEIFVKEYLDVIKNCPPMKSKAVYNWNIYCIPLHLQSILLNYSDVNCNKPICDLMDKIMNNQVKIKLAVKSLRGGNGDVIGVSNSIVNIMDNDKLVVYMKSNRQEKKDKTVNLNFSFYNIVNSAIKTYEFTGQLGGTYEKKDNTTPFLIKSQKNEFSSGKYISKTEIEIEDFIFTFEFTFIKLPAKSANNRSSKKIKGKYNIKLSYRLKSELSTGLPTETLLLGTKEAGNKNLSNNNSGSTNEAVLSFIDHVISSGNRFRASQKAIEINFGTLDLAKAVSEKKNINITSESFCEDLFFALLIGLGNCTF